MQRDSPPSIPMNVGRCPICVGENMLKKESKSARFNVSIPNSTVVNRSTSENELMGKITLTNTDGVLVGHLKIIVEIVQSAETIESRRLVTVGGDAL